MMQYKNQVKTMVNTKMAIKFPIRNLQRFSNEKEMWTSTKVSCPKLDRESSKSLKQRVRI